MIFRHAADLVDKVLREVKPDDIPVEQPTKFDLVSSRLRLEIVGRRATGMTQALCLSTGILAGRYETEHSPWTNPASLLPISIRLTRISSPTKFPTRSWKLRRRPLTFVA